VVEAAAQEGLRLVDDASGHVSLMPYVEDGFRIVALGTSAWVGCSLHERMRLMGERVVVRQDMNFQTEFLAVDPHGPDEGDLEPVANVYSLTPYGMLLASLGSCIGIVLHTYAQYHNVPLDAVELRLEYDRVFDEDCEKCEGIDEYREYIEMEIVLIGDELTEGDRTKLVTISRHCPIHKMLAHGITVRSILAEAGEDTWPQR